MNLWAVLVCMILNMVLGGLWYSALFGRIWMKLMKISPDHMKDPANRKLATIGYAISLACSLILPLVLGALIALTGAQGVAGGVQLGLLCWIGFVATTMIPNHVFGSAPLKLILINTGYPFVSLLLMGGILGGWR